MALINYSAREITLKIVYYGPGLSGKTTNLQHLHSAIAPKLRGKLLSLATETDRTLFFDFMPVTMGKVGEFGVRFQLYTVPGQVRYNATRKLVLKGADAVVFVADSQEALRDQNVDSYENMLENLQANNLDPHDIPVVLQYNKRDLDEIMSVAELDKTLNFAGHPTVEAEAVNGVGVDETFQLVTGVLINHIAAKHGIGLAAPKPPGAGMEKAALKPEPGPAAEPAPPPPSEPGAPLEVLEETTETMEEPEMPALSEVSDTFEVDELFEEPRSPLSKELPSMNYFSEPVAEKAPTKKPPRETAEEAAEAPPKVPSNGLEGEVAGIHQALEGIARELKSSQRNQETIIDLLRKIESSLRPSGGKSKRA